MSYTPNRDFQYMVALGSMPGRKIVPFILRKRNLGTTLDDIGNATLILPTLAAAASIISASALDNGVTPGTGARSIFVEGLNSNYDEASEIVTLNGTGAVLTTTTWIRIHKMTVLATGATGMNQGAITATIGGNIQSTIGVSSIGGTNGDNVSYNSNYTVPRGKNALILKAFVSTGKTNFGGHVGLWVRPFGGVFQEGFQTDCVQNFNFADFSYNIDLAEKTDLAVRGYGIGGSVDMFAYYALMVVDNGVL